MCSCSAENRFDCIVTGGGHAGSEAAVALARLGLSVLLISGNVDRLGYLSCNPAIGGLAKGHMVREIDALGGMMGLWADAGGIQFRTLNMSKGPAVRATRAQIDREAYQKVLKKTLFSTPGLRIWQDSVTEVLEENGHAAGVRTAQGLTFHARHVLLTTGTFLAGLIHIGLTHLPGGRLGDVGHQILRHAARQFADERRGVGADGVEVAQRDAVQALVGRAAVVQDVFGHLLRVAVGRGGGFAGFSG